MNPRMRGSAYQKGNQWHWEMIITFGDMPVDDPNALVIGDEKTSYISEAAAIKGMKSAVPGITKSIGEALGVKGKVIDYIDLTKGFKKISEKELLQ